MNFYFYIPLNIFLKLGNRHFHRDKKYLKHYIEPIIVLLLKQFNLLEYSSIGQGISNQ